MTNKLIKIKGALIVFWVFINTLHAFGQSQDIHYKGYIVDDEDGSQLEAVICELLDEHNNLIDYAISDSKGYFTLKPKIKAKLITFKLLGYSMHELPIERINNYDNIKISLAKTSFNLQEVVVTVPPIQSSNDTLRYNVGSFRSQEDKYVADILKKLPGIKVTENGTISYQGEAINKFYIEGRDLLGGQYNLATNNLDVDAVSFVEVLENNQHIKALKGVEFSEKAAINLKLKKGHTIKPIGEIKLGVGGSPILCDNSFFAAYLGNKIQTLANFKISNIGEYMLDEIEDKLDLSNLFAFEPFDYNILNPPSPQTVSLPANRHLFNKTYLGSINTLIPISQNSELKINLSHGYDKSTQNFYLEQNYAIGSDVLKIMENSDLKNKLRNSRLSVSYENNSLEKYIRNEAVFYNNNKNVNSNIVSNEEDLFVNNKNNPYYIQNSFQALIKSGNSNTISINSFLRFASNDESLKSSYTRASQKNLEELFNGEYFTTKNRIATSFRFLGNNLDIGANIIYKRRKLNNEILSEGLEVSDIYWLPYQKNVTEQQEYSLVPNYQIKKKDKLVFTINLPITFYKYSVKNNQESRFSDNRVAFMPTFSSNYKLNHHWELYSRLGYDFRYADDSSVLQNPFFRNYREIYIPTNTINNSRNYFISGRIRYKDIINMLFFNFYILYRHSEQNFINKLYNTTEWSYSTTEKRNNTGKMLTVNSDISKNFVPIKLSLTLNPSYTRFQSQLIQQDIVVNNTSNILSFKAKAELKAINKTSINYNAEFTATWNENDLSNTVVLKDLNQNLKLYFFPNKKTDIVFTANHCLYEIRKNKYSSSFFSDITARYRLKKMEFALNATNIFNSDIYNVTYLSTVNSFYQELPLRGREILFSVKFSF